MNEKIKKMKFVGLSGFATAGKDLFFTLLDQVYPSIRFSLADLLKKELRQQIKDEFAIDILNCTTTQKNKVRPFLVEYGTRKRIETEGTHWIKKLDQTIKNRNLFTQIPVVTDIRYSEYENDEVQWLKNDLKGVLVYIKKYRILNGEKVYLSPPNEEEKRNDPALRKAADYVVDWEHSPGSMDEVEPRLTPEIKKFLDWYRKLP